MSLLLLFNQSVNVPVAAQAVAAAKKAVAVSEATALQARSTAMGSAQTAVTDATALTALAGAASMAQPQASYAAPLLGQAATASFASGAPNFTITLRARSETAISASFGPPSVATALSGLITASVQRGLQTPAITVIPAMVARGPLGAKRTQKNLVAYNGVIVSPPKGLIRGSYVTNQPLIAQAPLTRTKK